jgi:cell division protein FtsA
MEKSEIIVGLDIGTTKIVALVGRLNEHGKVELLGMGKAPSVGVHRGVVTHISQTTDSIIQAIAEASKSAGVNINIVNVGIAGQHIKSYQHRGILTRANSEDDITQKDIDELVSNMMKLAMPPGEEIIHALPQEYIVDNQPAIGNPIGMMGARLEANFHIISGQMSAAKNIIRCVNRAGLEVSDLILEPLASSEAVLHNDEKEAGVALVDIGGGTTDLAIFQEGIIRHTAVIPLGGNIITEDIKTGLNIIKDYAEALKIQHGSALVLDNMGNKIITIPGIHGRPAKEIQMKNLAGIIQARMSEIFEFVDYEIKNSGFKHKLSAGIVLTGGGSLLKHSRQLTEFVTGLETRIGLPNSHLAGSLADKVANPIYSTGIGLVMMGFEKFKHRETTDENNEHNKDTKKKSRIKGPSKMAFGDYFSRLIKTGIEFFNEDETELK